jgi:threonine dehydrogenase-like Zn-dependent dehydrogenase
LQADDTVLVIGQGPIGLMHAALARRTGARVLTSDLYSPSATPLRREIWAEGAD